MARDPRKSRSNLAKHRISFEEAKTVFLDENARLISDPDHSEPEQRFVMLGYSFQARCLIVSHCYREADTVVRLISARRLDTESVNYFKQTSADLGMPYQNLINLYLRDCLAQNRRVQIKWPSAA